MKELYGSDYELSNSKIWIRKDLESEDKVMTDILQRKRVIEDNQLRRHLNDGEKTMIYIEKKRLEEILAKIRQKEEYQTKGRNGDGQFSTGGKISTDGNKGKARDKAAEGLNLSGRTLENYEKMYAFGISKGEECVLYSNNNFFKNKYRVSIIRRDSLKDLKIKRYY